MKTVCIDGPLYGKIREFPGTRFRYPLPPQRLEVIGALTESENPALVPLQFAEYNLMRLPYNRLRQDPTGGVDYDEMSIGGAELVYMLASKAHFDSEHRSWCFWTSRSYQ